MAGKELSQNVSMVYYIDHNFLHKNPNFALAGTVRTKTIYYDIDNG
jgi:hypothetical protein